MQTKPATMMVTVNIEWFFMQNSNRSYGPFFLFLSLRAVFPSFLGWPSQFICLQLANTITATAATAATTDAFVDASHTHLVMYFDNEDVSMVIYTIATAK